MSSKCTTQYQKGCHHLTWRKGVRHLRLHWHIVPNSSVQAFFDAPFNSLHLRSFAVLDKIVNPRWLRALALMMKKSTLHN